MILLVTPSGRASECAKALSTELRENVEVAPSIRRASMLARRSEFNAIILDEPVLESEPDGVDALLSSSGMALPLYVNLAISGVERVVRDVKLGLRRYQEERLVAMRAAATLLRTELRGAVAGILLSSELAMRIPSMPPEALDKLSSVCQLAGEIRSHLETTA